MGIDEMGDPPWNDLRQDRFIRLTHLQNRFQSAAATSRQTRGLNNRRISVVTVLRRLRNAGMRARRPYLWLKFNALTQSGTLTLVQEHRKSISLQIKFPFRLQTINMLGIKNTY